MLQRFGHAWKKGEGMRLGTFDVENLFDRAAAMVNK